MPEKTADATIPVTIVGGFLGAGKTSLLRHILGSDHGMRIAVLVNDFGEIDIDARLIVAVEGTSMVSMANGCVCCTIRDDLLTEVLRLCEMDPRPEYIVIETSGVSDPRFVAWTFMIDEAREKVHVDGIIAVLEADFSSIPEDFQELARSQVQVADIVVLNKIDLVTPEQLEEMRGFVKETVPRARLIETTHGRVPLEMVLGLSEFNPLLVSDSHEHEHHHEREFSTWKYRSDAAWPMSALHRAVEAIPLDVYRAKGIVRLAVSSDDHGVLQVTGKRGWLNLEPHAPGTGPQTTEIVFIGKVGATTDEGIHDIFERALSDTLHPGDDGFEITDLRAFQVVFS